MKKNMIWAGLGLVGVVVVGLLVLRGGPAASSTESEEQRNAGSGIPVKTTRPIQKMLQRQLTVPASIKAAAQAELYAKTSGYLKFVQREWSQADPKRICAQIFAKPLPLLAPPAHWSRILGQRIVRACEEIPEKDIGSRVKMGECLLEVDTPEQVQDIAEKASILQQKEAEYDAAVLAIQTYEASLEAAKAQKAQAQTDITRAMEEHTFRTKQLARLESLVRDGTVVPEILDEKQFQTKAARAAWESSKAKLAIIEADVNVLASKLATAKADLKVKRSLVQVANDILERAKIVANYSKIIAPFSGVITSRSVDVGDFVQNSSSGSARPLLTVSAVDKLRFVGQVPERDAPWVHAGKTEVVIHHIDAVDRYDMKAVVTRTSRSLDSASRTMQIEIDVENKDGVLLPGMYGQMTLSLQKIENAYAIPATAVNSRKGMNYVMLVTNGIAHHQPVRITFDDGRELQVMKLMSGREVPLDGTEVLIVSNKGEIADGQQVHVSR